jgi:CysZ protein
MSGRKSGVGRFFAGMGYATRGFGFVSAHPSLWPWVLAPAVVTLAAAVFGGAAAWHWGQRFIDSHVAQHHLLGWLIGFLLFIVSIGVAYVAYLAVSLVATAPFAGTLSERTEKLATGELVTPEGVGAILRAALRSTWHVTIAVAVWLAVEAVLMVVHWVAAPLTPLVWIGNLYVTALLIAFNAWDLSFARRDARFADKWGALKRHFAESLGFGVAVALLLCVPGLGLLIAPLAAVGGTLMFVELERR